MNNIFEGAKFGDKFLTRDGRKSVVVNIRENYITLFIERSHTEKSKVWGEYDYLKDLNGIFELENFHKLDIVSRYQEPIDDLQNQVKYQSEVIKEMVFVGYRGPIDEDKLDGLANEYATYKYGDYNTNETKSYVNPNIAEAYKAGYRKAMEE